MNMGRSVQWLAHELRKRKPWKVGESWREVLCWNGRREHSPCTGQGMGWGLWGVFPHCMNGNGCVEEHWVHPDGHCVNCSMTLWSLNDCRICMTETLWCYMHSPMTKSMIDTAIENRWNPMHQWHHHPYADSNTKAKSQMRDRWNCVSKPMNWHVAYLKSSVSIP